MRKRRRRKRNSRDDLSSPRKWGGGPAKRGRGRRVSGGMMEPSRPFAACGRDPFDPSFAKASEGPLPRDAGKKGFAAYSNAASTGQSSSAERQRMEAIFHSPSILNRVMKFTPVAKTSPVTPFTPS